MSRQASGPSEPHHAGVVALGRAGLANVDFRKVRFDELQIGVANFVSCDFRGLRLAERFSSLFTTRPRSVFTNCRFDEADMRQTSPEGTRFERCTFDDAQLNGWGPTRAEFVNCRFAGSLAHVTFAGRPIGPGAADIYPPRERNEFAGNDFRDAELIDTVFAYGIDLDRQRWPAGDYVRLDRFPERLARVEADVMTWDPDEARAEAVDMLKTLRLRWREQSEVIALRISPGDLTPPRLQHRVWYMLEHARLST